MLWSGGEKCFRSSECENARQGSCNRFTIRVEREGVVKDLKKMKLGKLSQNWITVEFLKCEGESLIEWIIRTCKMHKEVKRVPENEEYEISYCIRVRKIRINVQIINNLILLLNIQMKIYWKIFMEKITK